MVRRAALEPLPIFQALRRIRRPTRCIETASRQDGYVLIEIVAVLAIIGLLAAIILPAIPRATSRTRLEAFALDVATLVTQDRNAAVRRRTQVATQIDAPARLVVSGATGRQLRLPADVAVD